MVSHAGLIMTKIEQPDEIYLDIEILIDFLKTNGQHKMAAILEHRMYKVSWTSSSELLEEIENVLKRFQEESGSVLDTEASKKMKRISESIKSLASKQ